MSLRVYLARLRFICWIHIYAGYDPIFTVYCGFHQIANAALFSVVYAAAVRISFAGITALFNRFNWRLFKTGLF